MQIVLWIQRVFIKLLAGLLHSLEPLLSVALTAKNLKVLQFRTSTCSKRNNMVYGKAIYLLLVILSSSFKAAAHTCIRVSLISGPTSRFWHGWSKPPSYAPFCIQHVLCTFFLLDMNNWFAFRAKFSPTRKFQITGVTDAALLGDRVIAVWSFTENHDAVGINHTIKVAKLMAIWIPSLSYLYT